MMMNAKQPISIHGPLNHGPLPGRYSPPYRHQEPIRRINNSPGNIFGGIDESLLARAEALADISKNSSGPLVKPDSIYGHTPDMSIHNGGGHRGQMPLHGFNAPGESMLDQLTGVSMPGLTNINTDHNGMMMSHGHGGQQMYGPQTYNHPNNPMPSPHHQHHGIPNHPTLMHPQGTHPEMDCDPRELEAFAEHFKQRRIKLGVTQADVGQALGKLKLPGVGSLSQSTICRFESLTLSHNNMVALKPVLQAWLEDAEKAARETKQNGELYSQLADKKRKRTSIAAPEKRSLEAYFTIQPRPSGEKIAQIAEKLDLKKNVVRVWFCNQRQKQKRMKFSATMQTHGGHGPH